MRGWFSPDGELVELDVDDNHAMSVANNPENFGLCPIAVDRHLSAFHAGDMDFDFDTIIALAESYGWVRVSEDAPLGRLSVSASNKKSARKCIRHLSERGMVPDGGIDLGIEHIEGERHFHAFVALNVADVALFVDKGHAELGRTWESVVDDPTLLQRDDLEVTVPSV